MIDVLTLTVKKARATTTASLRRPKATGSTQPAKTQRQRKQPAQSPMWMMVAGMGD